MTSTGFPPGRDGSRRERAGRRSVIRALLVVVALVRPAGAETITLPNTQATIELGTSWRATEIAGLVAGYLGARGAVLAVTRAQLPNLDAWRSKTRAAYLDEIERGVASRIEGYRRKRRRLVHAQGVPALDLEARRRDGATIVIRVLLFRTYALCLAIELPRRGDVPAARAIAASFSPPPAS